MRIWLRDVLSRRGLLRGGLATAGGSILGAIAASSQTPHGGHGPQGAAGDAKPGGEGAHNSHGAHGGMITVGEVDNARNGFDPTSLLTDWETGTVSTLPDGRTLGLS